MFKRNASPSSSNGHDLLDEITAKVAEYDEAAQARQQVVRSEIAALQAESAALHEVTAIAARVSGR